jgi:PilZ domain
MRKRKSLVSATLEKIWPKKFTRRHERHVCNMEVELYAGSRQVRLSGKLMDISLGGALFRPSTFYLMERSGEHAVLVVSEIEIEAEIVGTIPFGYSLRFEGELDESVLASVLAERDARQAAQPQAEPVAA